MPAIRRTEIKCICPELFSLDIWFCVWHEHSGLFFGLRAWRLLRVDFALKDHPPLPRDDLKLGLKKECI